MTQEREAVARIIQEEVCCARPTGGCEISCYPEHCPAQKAAARILALRSGGEGWRPDDEGEQTKAELARLRRHLEIVGLCPKCAGSHPSFTPCAGPVSAARPPHDPVA